MPAPEEVPEVVLEVLEAAPEGEPARRARGRGWARALRRRVPAAAWAARYSRAAAVADLVAGVTLGLTLVPQSIAYAALADLPVQYGLYSAFVGTMVYAALGSVKEVSIGPTSLMSLMTLQACQGLPADFVVLLTFLAGLVVLLMGLLRLGFLVELISPAVTSGFTSATAVIVVAAQLKGLLGLSFVAESIPDNVAQLARRLRDARPADCLLSLACCSALLALRKLKDLPVSPKRRRLRKALWLVSIARNALVVCAAAALAYATHSPERPLFKLSGRVEQGVPRLALPPFSTTVGNRTVGFAEMVSTLGSGVVMLPVVMVLANIAIAKAFTAGGRVDATQEMLALGLCNCAGALVRAMPTCGAFTRSAVAHSSGVRTPAASLYAGLITLLALNFLTEYFFFIPRACLSSVLICAVIFMVDARAPAQLWRGGAAARAQAGVLLLTFAVGVARGVELAVAAGALAALALALRALIFTSDPVHQVKVRGGAARVLRPPRALLYANAERFAARALRTAPPLLVDCSALAMLDYDAAQVVARLVAQFKERQQPLVFYAAGAGAAGALRAVPGLDARALSASTAQRALDAVAAAPAPAESAALLAAEPPDDRV